MKVIIHISFASIHSCENAKIITIESIDVTASRHTSFLALHSLQKSITISGELLPANIAIQLFAIKHLLNSSAGTGKNRRSHRVRKKHPRGSTCGEVFIQPIDDDLLLIQNEKKLKLKQVFKAVFTKGKLASFISNVNGKLRSLYCPRNPFNAEMFRLQCRIH